MIIQLSATSKLMLGGLALSLGWFLFEGCSCDEDTSKPVLPPNSWVGCIDNKPTLLRFILGTPTRISDSSFDPSRWDCTHPASPAYSNSIHSPYPVASPILSSSAKRAATGGGVAYLAPQLRDLPFIPDIPPSAPSSTCDPTQPDVLQTVHTRALVTRASTCPFQIKATIPVVSRPLQIAITHDGSLALVTSFDNAVNFINLASNQVIFTLMTDASFNPHGVAIMPDDSRAFITSFNPNGPGLAVLDMATRKFVATMNTDAFPQGAFLTPDGSQLWITYPLGQAVDVIDTLTLTSVTRLGIGQSTGVAFNSKGTRAYVTSGSTNSVVSIDASTYKTLKSYPVGAGPTDIEMSYGDRFLIVNNSGDNSISVLDLVTGVATTTKVGGVPSGISFVQ